MIDDEEPIEDYETLLNDLTKKWSDLEVKHQTSKTGSEEFWDLAKSYFPKLHRARIEEMVYKPIPKLKSQRNKVYNDNVPPINLEIGYINRETEDLTVVNVDKTPIKQFRPNQYEKVFEVASVKVNYL